jgi:hypothetical protein
VKSDSAIAAELEQFFQSLRVYYQCQMWMSETVDIDPTDWGWEIKRGKLCPILMELTPAPENLLSVHMYLFVGEV